MKKQAKNWIRLAKDFETGHGFTGKGKQRAPSDAEIALIDMNRYLRKMQRGDEDADIMVSWDVSCLYNDCRVTARPRDMIPQGVQTSEIHSFELVPKTLEILGFCPKVLQLHGF